MRAQLTDAAALTGAEAVAGVLAARAALRELAQRGITPGAELTAEVDRAVSGVMLAGDDALAGTELDPAAMTTKRAKLIARAEALLPKAPELKPDLSPAELIATLKSAIASRALGDFGAGRDPFEALHELRTAWADVGPVVGDDAVAQLARFDDLCARVRAAAEAEGHVAPSRDEQPREDRGRRDARGARDRSGGDRSGGDRSGGDRGRRREPRRDPDADASGAR